MLMARNASLHHCMTASRHSTTCASHARIDDLGRFLDVVLARVAREVVAAALSVERERDDALAKLKTIAKLSKDHHMPSHPLFQDPRISSPYKKIQNDRDSLFIFEIYLGCLEDLELGLVILDHTRHAGVGPLETALGLVR